MGLQNISYFGRESNICMHLFRLLVTPTNANTILNNKLKEHKMGVFSKLFGKKQDTHKSEALNETSQKLNIETNNQLFITGYSQGGHAAMATHKMIQEDYANQVLAQNGVNVKVYQDQDSVYLDLENGRIDASLQDMVQAQFTFIRDGKNTDYVNTKIVDALLPADSAVAVRKNDKNTLAWFNEGLNKIHQNGNFEKIQTKYFGQLVLSPVKED